MTPEQAQTIYYECVKVEYGKHAADYTPINQSKVILAGFQAVIDAVSKEIHTEYAEKYMKMRSAVTYDFNGTGIRTVQQDAAEPGERNASA